jgi:hypothetical protein
MSTLLQNLIQIKRRIFGSAGAPSSLENGELAYNEIDNTLYYGASGGEIRKIAGSGAYVDLNTNQTIEAEKTFVGFIDLGNSAMTITPSLSDSSNLIANTEFVHRIASNLDGGGF